MVCDLIRGRQLFFFIFKTRRLVQAATLIQIFNIDIDTGSRSRGCLITR